MRMLRCDRRHSAFAPPPAAPPPLPDQPRVPPPHGRRTHDTRLAGSTGTTPPRRESGPPRPWGASPGPPPPDGPPFPPSPGPPAPQDRGAVPERLLDHRRRGRGALSIFPPGGFRGGAPPTAACPLVGGGAPIGDHPPRHGHRRQGAALAQAVVGAHQSRARVLLPLRRAGACLLEGGGGMTAALGGRLPRRVRGRCGGSCWGARKGGAQGEARPSKRASEGGGNGRRTTHAGR